MSCVASGDAGQPRSAWDRPNWPLSGSTDPVDVLTESCCECCEAGRSPVFLSIAFAQRGWSALGLADKAYVGRWFIGQVPKCPISHSSTQRCAGTY